MPPMSTLRPAVFLLGAVSLMSCGYSTVSSGDAATSDLPPDVAAPDASRDAPAASDGAWALDSARDAAVEVARDGDVGDARGDAAAPDDVGLDGAPLDVPADVPGADADAATRRRTDVPPPYSPATIDWMDMNSAYERYDRTRGMQVMGSGRRYRLSDGSEWSSGAGSGSYGTMSLSRVERAGATLRYVMTPMTFLLERTDYNSGDHSAHYRLDAVGEIVIVAIAGTATAQATGRVRLALDAPANYRDARFNFTSALVGDTVPFQATYTLRAPAAFTETLFEGPFEFGGTMEVDFTAATPP